MNAHQRRMRHRQFVRQYGQDFPPPVPTTALEAKLAAFISAEFDKAEAIARAAGVPPGLMPYFNRATVG